MADAVAAGSPARTVHTFAFTKTLDLPLESQLTGNAALQQSILNDLRFRMNEVDALKAELLKSNLPKPMRKNWRWKVG